MTFSTIFSMFQSQVMQMGDCNAPSTFQRLMTAIFRDFLGRFVHVYLDNIFIYSQSIREHIEHIIKVLQRLRELQFYLSRSKLDLFSDKTDCLGHVIDDNGIHTELDKMRRIREWRIPQNYNEVQKVPWTSTIPGIVHARHNGIHHSVIRIGTKQPNLPVDTTTG